VEIFIFKEIVIHLDVDAFIEIYLFLYKEIPRLRCKYV